jgi:hypothetical protein
MMLSVIILSANMQSIIMLIIIIQSIPILGIIMLSGIMPIVNMLSVIMLSVGARCITPFATWNTSEVGSCFFSKNPALKAKN